MQTHTTIGGRILGESRSPVLQMAEQIALTHHECWDGSGYPAGPAGRGHPAGGPHRERGRRVRRPDARAALQEGWPAEEAAAEIERRAGGKFDPMVVAAFLEQFRRGLLG